MGLFRVSAQIWVSPFRKCLLYMPHSEYLSATRLIPRFWILYQGEPHGGFLSAGFHRYTCVTPDDKLMPEVAYILPQMMKPF